MAQSQYSLSWGEYKKNICYGLSYLQQNGEFVDMTLAADGYFVKVHQVVLALTSPFIKDLIKSADCPHPVIILNKIKYSTLCSILEYIYTGEVLVSVDNLDEFIEAGKELHIKGLENMKPHHHNLSASQYNYQQTQSTTMEHLNEEIYFEVTSHKNNDDQTEMNFENPLDENKPLKVMVEDSYDDDIVEVEDRNNISMDNHLEDQGPKEAAKEINTKNVRVMQYTVSNQGSLQMILNRYLYYLKHTNRNNTRQWRCVDYIGTLKCPAHVVTKDDMVVQRVRAHTHPFHDKKILKKVKAGAIFTAIQEAEKEGSIKRIKSDSGENLTLDENKPSKVTVEDDDNIVEDRNNYDMVSKDDYRPIENQGPKEAVKEKDTKKVRVTQYTVSNQGSLQVILNRYLYYLKHTSRNNNRKWRCVDYIGKLKCPAHVVTKDDTVLQRVGTHTHPFHDKKILKKVKAGAIFTAIQEAEKEGSIKRIKSDSGERITCVDIINILY